MRYKGRDLRRLFEMKVYEGDPNAKRPKTRKETVIALNATDAIRKCGGMAVAERPKALHYVTWDDKPLRIDDTSGPKGAPVLPSIKDQADDQGE